MSWCALLLTFAIAVSVPYRFRTPCLCQILTENASFSMAHILRQRRLLAIKIHFSEMKVELEDFFLLATV